MSMSMSIVIIVLFVIVIINIVIRFSIMSIVIRRLERAMFGRGDDTVGDHHRALISILPVIPPQKSGKSSQPNKSRYYIVVCYMMC